MSKVLSLTDKQVEALKDLLDTTELDPSSLLAQILDKLNKPNHVKSESLGSYLLERD